MVERFVQNRGGYRVFEPAKPVVDPCVCDLAVALIIGVTIWRASRRSRTHAA